ncbi:MAG: peroxidase family protein [Chthoniobacterales bacterium]
MIIPYEPGQLPRYSRLFAPNDSPFHSDEMEALGCFMERGKSPISDLAQGTPLPAGYTYFGQFIDHDLTRDDIPLAAAVGLCQAPSEVVNRAGGRLDLNHLYGDGPYSKKHGHLFASDGASFRLAQLRFGLGDAVDFPLGPAGPEAVEDRNLENVILRQLCAMFLKLHNCAVQEESKELTPQRRFHRARSRVSWQYQWLVREDYLFRLVKREVYQSLVERGRSKIDWTKTGFSIPIEFSQAAFRFGHSMVRSQYDLNDRSRRTPLDEIFSFESRGRPLTSETVVDWNSFLGAGRPFLTMPSLPIDTNIAPPLFHLPKELHPELKSSARNLPTQLSVRTLLRGAANRIATGEQVAKAFGLSSLRERCPNGGEESWAKLDELGLTGRTPLWYYILLEAEVEQHGLRLGTLGSQLVLEVIDGCLRNDPNSYLSRAGANWRPAAWKAPGGEILEIRRLSDVAKVTGLSHISGRSGFS